MNARLFVGLMSGTSLDGVDAVVADLAGDRPRLVARTHRPFDDSLRGALAGIMTPGVDEIDRGAALANALAHEYAAVVGTALHGAGIRPDAICAIGCHGQTVRHRPERGYTVQIGNAALLAELSGIRVVSDFRSRDVAAGGQGAPLVPAFHSAIFRSQTESRAVINLGGIANLTWLPPGGPVTGFDCGPGNGLLDAWAAKHLGARYDADGKWAAGGREDAALLDRFLGDPWFGATPPKSTGRELFNYSWLAARLGGSEPAVDVQATLLALTACAAADALRRWCPGATRLIACGGGTQNGRMMARLAEAVPWMAVESCAAHGIDPRDVEALAFAWLAREALDGRCASLPSVTGAKAARVLGAIYPR